MILAPVRQVSGIRLLDSGLHYFENGSVEKALGNIKIAEMAFREMGMDYWVNETQQALARGVSNGIVASMHNETNRIMPTVIARAVFHGGRKPPKIAGREKRKNIVFVLV